MFGGERQSFHEGFYRVFSVFQIQVYVQKEQELEYGEKNPVLLFIKFSDFFFDIRILFQPMELPQAFGILLFKPPFQDLLFLFQMFPYMGMFF